MMFRTSAAFARSADAALPGVRLVLPEPAAVPGCATGGAELHPATTVANAIRPSTRRTSPPPSLPAHMLGRAEVEHQRLGHVRKLASAVQFGDHHGAAPHAVAGDVTDLGLDGSEHLADLLPC